MSISVVIPTHNRPQKLNRALRSIYEQTRYPEELIVVDDGSAPSVEEKIFDDCPPEINTKLIRNEKSKGGCVARNIGVDHAAGEWIAFLDDDDEFLPEKINRVKSLLNSKNENFHVIYHPAKFVIHTEGISYINLPEEFDEADDIFKHLLIKNRVGGTPMLVIRKDIIDKVGGFSENMPARHDYELLLKISSKITNVKFELINEPLTKVNYHTSRDSFADNVQNVKKAIKIIHDKYEKELADLNQEELSEHYEDVNKLLTRKALNNYRRFLASKFAFKAFKSRYNVKFFVAGLISLLSPWLMLKLYSLQKRLTG